MMTFLGYLGILAIMFLLLLRAMRGPTVPDRILAANAFGSATVALIAYLAVKGDRLAFIDIALVYALINFIGTVAALKFFEYGRFDADRERHPSPSGKEVS